MSSEEKKKVGKERLDLLVVRNGLAPSREQAKALIMEGKIVVNDQREDKPGSTFPVDCSIRIKGEVMPFVSRGGYKLAKAVEVFEISLKDKICMDVGASTGGFTDCMLQNGAKKVYAIDVGTNQLAWKLRQDERVVSMEKTNIRYVKKEALLELVSFASIDVAFISLTKVLEPVSELLEDDGRLVCLIKPQFEAGKQNVGKKGVVRDKKIHVEVIWTVVNYSMGIGLNVLGLDFSPVKGPEGNIEYLLYLGKGACGGDREISGGITTEDIKKLVDKAHQELL